MKESNMCFTLSITAVSAALMMTGCCGPKGDRTHARYGPSSTTQYSSSDTEASTSSTYASQPQTTTTQTETERTRVRESNVNTGNAQNDYSLPLYSESLRVGKREVENGSVRLRKVVKTENASQPIDLRRETVVIDREAFDQAQRAANAGQPNDLGAAFQEKEITIDLKREEPVVEVQPFVSGRIVAQKRSTTERQNIDRQIRREDVEVIKTGNDRDITISERVRVQNEAVGAPGNTQIRQTGTNSNTRVNVNVNTND